MEAYCVRCKKKVDIVKPSKSKTKTGVPMTKGYCSECGGKVCKIGG